MRAARVLKRKLSVLWVLAVAGLVAPLPATPAAAAEWAWPLAGPQEVSRPFAPPASRYGAGHRGADLPAAPGAGVRAAGAGRVTYAGLLAGRGVVVVSHGPLRTTYEPVTAAVRVGSAVALGEVIGHLEPGHAGCPVAACLHWGLRRGEEYLDPVRLVRGGPVRLLPLDGSAPGSLVPAGAARAPDAVPYSAPPAPAATAPRDAAPQQVEEPSWSVRAAETPLGAAAVIALVLGIGLLARPRPLPPAPVSGGLAAPAVPLQEDLQEEPLGPPATLLDLDEARARRQAAS